MIDMNICHVPASRAIQRHAYNPLGVFAFKYAYTHAYIHTDIHAHVHTYILNRPVDIHTCMYVSVAPAHAHTHMHFDSKRYVDVLNGLVVQL